MSDKRQGYDTDNSGGAIYDLRDRRRYGYKNLLIGFIIITVLLSGLAGFVGFWFGKKNNNALNNYPWDSFDNDNINSDKYDRFIPNNNNPAIENVFGAQIPIVGGNGLSPASFLLGKGGCSISDVLFFQSVVAQDFDILTKNQGANTVSDEMIEHIETYRVPDSTFLIRDEKNILVDYASRNEFLYGDGDQKKGFVADTQFMGKVALWESPGFEVCTGDEALYTFQGGNNIRGSPIAVNEDGITRLFARVEYTFVKEKGTGWKASAISFVIYGAPLPDIP